MMRLWDRSAFLNGWISASQKVRVDSSWSSSQSKQLSIFLMVQNRLQSEHSAYSFVEFILKCISNHFDNPETFILCQYPRADCVTFYILYWHVFTVCASWFCADTIFRNACYRMKWLPPLVPVQLCRCDDCWRVTFWILASSAFVTQLSEYESAQSSTAQRIDLYFTVSSSRVNVVL